MILSAKGELAIPDSSPSECHALEGDSIVQVTPHVNQHTPPHTIHTHGPRVPFIPSDTCKHTFMDTHTLHTCVPPYFKRNLTPRRRSWSNKADRLGSEKGTPWKTLQEDVAPISNLVNRVREGEPLVLWESPTRGTCSHRDGSQNKEEPLLWRSVTCLLSPSSSSPSGVTWLFAHSYSPKFTEHLLF